MNHNITILCFSNRCGAQVGYHPGINFISLNENCSSHPSLLHELGHTIGFVHEHSRPDRDDYIAILWENISPGSEVNFCKFHRNVVDSLNHDYDYVSIMHYSSRTFSVNGKRTIKPVKPGITFGTSTHLSASDIQKANEIYNCSKGKRHYLPLAVIGCDSLLFLLFTSWQWGAVNNEFINRSVVCFVYHN